MAANATTLDLDIGVAFSDQFHFRVENCGCRIGEYLGIECHADFCWHGRVGPRVNDLDLVICLGMGQGPIDRSVRSGGAVDTNDDLLAVGIC